MEADFDRMAESVLNEEPFRRSARCYAAMMEELIQNSVDKDAAKDIVVAHIAILAAMAKGTRGGGVNVLLSRQH